MTTKTTTPPRTATLMYRLAKKITRNTPEDELGMRLRQFWVLSHLAEKDGIPQHELADAFMMDANNAVLLLNELEDAGWIERRRNPDDRRRHDVFVTDAGRQAVTRAQEASAAAEAATLSNLALSERETLRALLVKALEE